VFAPQPKGFEEALSWRRRGDAQFPEIIVNYGDRRRGVSRSFILDDSRFRNLARW
jgi:hypothetical protein